MLQILVKILKYGPLLSWTPCSKVKVKCTLVQALRLCTGSTVQWGSRGIALPFHDHGTRRGWGVSVTPRPFFTPGKTRHPLYRRLGGPQGRSGQVRKISPQTGFDPRTVQAVASHYTDWATRPTFHMKNQRNFMTISSCLRGKVHEVSLAMWAQCAATETWRVFIVISRTTRNVST
jgi:hypothetical protein